MRILHVYKDYVPIPGGIENHIRWLAQEQTAKGHAVSVLVTNPSDEPSRDWIDGVRVVRAQRLTTVASTPLSVTFPLLLRRERPDIVHLHFPYPLGELSQWLFGRKYPYVITYHSDVVKQQQILRLYGPLLRRVLAGADRILPTSDNYRQSSPWLRHLDNCTTVPLGIDPTPYLTLPRRTTPNERVKVLFVGRHRYYKGVDDLIRAMQHVDGEAIIVGNGPERTRWEQLSRELNLSRKIYFAGYVPDERLPALYNSADIFCLPANARAEAFGLVLLEAMAAGLPCVTTELGSGTSYVVQHGATGLVVPPRAPEQLAAALNRLVGDPTLRHKMGESGRERVREQFTLFRMADKVFDVYKSVLRD